MKLDHLEGLQIVCGVLRRLQVDRRKEWLLLLKTVVHCSVCLLLAVLVVVWFQVLQLEVEVVDLMMMSLRPVVRCQVVRDPLVLLEVVISIWFVWIELRMKSQC